MQTPPDHHKCGPKIRKLSNRLDPCARRGESFRISSYFSWCRVAKVPSSPNLFWIAGRLPLSRCTAWMCGEYFVPVLARCFSCGGCSGTGLWGKLWAGFLGKTRPQCSPLAWKVCHFLGSKERLIIRPVRAGRRTLPNREYFQKRGDSYSELTSSYWVEARKAIWAKWMFWSLWKRWSEGHHEKSLFKLPSNHLGLFRLASVYRNRVR